MFFVCLLVILSVALGGGESRNSAPLRVPDFLTASRALTVTEVGPGVRLSAEHYEFLTEQYEYLLRKNDDSSQNTTNS